MDTVESPKFLDQLKTLHKDSVDGIPGLDLRVDEILINVGREEPSLWIWVSDEMLHENVEEKSGIDNDNYVVISQEQVLDAIGNFMARCALLNPKAANMTPEEMQKNILPLSVSFIYSTGIVSILPPPKTPCPQGVALECLLFLMLFGVIAALIDVNVV
ncbi:hypothetical protein Tco_1059693 [Tanacetum coccineum]